MKKTPLQYALDLVALRDRTEFEIRKKMAEKKFPEEEIIKTIDWLKDKRFIDDERFVDNYIKAQCSAGRNGCYKIKFKLNSLGINKELIEKYFSEVDSDDEKGRARELADRWIIKNENKDKKYEKLGRFLISRGFGIEVVQSTLGEVLKGQQY
jgi:regulatory protein